MCRDIGILFFKQETAYEMRISDWSSDVCSSDLPAADPDPLRRWNRPRVVRAPGLERRAAASGGPDAAVGDRGDPGADDSAFCTHLCRGARAPPRADAADGAASGIRRRHGALGHRSEEHTSELQSLMRISSAVFCLKKNT